VNDDPEMVFLQQAQVEQEQEQEQVKQEQEQADQYFWSLLNKARESAQQRKRKRPPISNDKSEETASVVTSTSTSTSPPKVSNISINGPNDDNNHRNHSVLPSVMWPTSFGPNLKEPLGYPCCCCCYNYQNQ
jgi:hypothetical protein